MGVRFQAGFLSAEALEAVELGERVRIARRSKVVAQLGLPEPESSPLAWPYPVARFQRFEVPRSDGVPASRIIDEDRQERF